MYYLDTNILVEQFKMDMPPLAVPCAAGFFRPFYPLEQRGENRESQELTACKGN